jgi:hypothetical protein
MLGMLKQTGVKSVEELSDMKQEEFQQLLVKYKDKFRMSRVRLGAIKYIKDNAFDHVRSLAEPIIETATQEERALAEKKRQLKTMALREEMVKRLLAGEHERRTVSNLVKRTGDAKNDWFRVVYTETNNAYQQGIAESIIASFPPGYDIKVYKSVWHNCCGKCREFYLEADGVTPKVYSLSELIANGSNVGRKRSEYKPVVGSTHPFCRCGLTLMPPGAYFENGKMKYTRLQK